MNKDNTQLRLEIALQRILGGKPERVSEQRKLSVRAVEEEANLGNGSSYYYPEIIEKVKTEKAKLHTQKTGKKSTSELTKAREAKKKEISIKEKYRDRAYDLQAELEQMAAVHHQLSHALRKAYKRISQMEQEIDDLKNTLADSRRKNIVTLKLK